jgi:signal recognition particle receptor subunit beta/uncharacterized coiled-coil protein SlyX
MVIYNAATRELTAKIVYYGPGLCGKTTNLKVLHDRLEPGTAGRLLNLQTQTDRTIYFDLLPVELGDIKGYKIRFQLATVPGQTAFNETRRVVLKGVDGIVFVADSQWTMLPKNLESWQNLKDNLKSNEITFEKIPVVVQYNKRDLADILAVDAMQEALGLSSYPFVEAVASAGRGVTETFKLISKLTFVDLLRRLQGRRAEEAGAAAPTPKPEQVRHDDLQTWKDSLLNRESQSVPAAPERPSRPFALVPRVSDEAPFDTTELGRGVDEDEGSSPFSVRAPPDLASTAPAEAVSPAETVQMEAVRPEEAEEAPEAPEVLAEAEEVEIEILANEEPVTDPAFLPAEAATADGRIQLLEQRLHAAEDRANHEREASERLAQALAAVQERVAASSENLSALGERLGAIEKGVGGLHDDLGSALQRLAPMESAAGRHQDLEESLRGLEAGLRDLDERLRSDSTRQRKDSDDVAMALRALTERAQIVDQQIAAMVERVGGHQNALSALSGLAERVPQLEGQLSELRELSGKLPQLEAQVEAVLRQHHDIEATLDEKTQQGRREAEDIRSQIAPLLEERVRRHESDALLFSEMERLRESLADSLHDLAERLRHAVRE